MLNIKNIKIRDISIIIILLILFNCSDKKSPNQPTEPEIIINSETKVLKEGTMQYLKSINENEIVFDKQAEGIADLKVGNIIVSGEGSGLSVKVT